MTNHNFDWLVILGSVGGNWATIGAESADELGISIISKIHRIIEAGQNIHDSLFKSGRVKSALKIVGLAAAAALATTSFALIVLLLLPVAVATEVLGLLGGSVIPGAELALNWDNGRQREWRTDCSIK